MFEKNILFLIILICSVRIKKIELKNVLCREIYNYNNL